MPGLCNLLRLLDMRIVGIDASLTATGYATLDDRGIITTGRVLPKKIRGMPRLIYIRDILSGILDEVKPTLVAIEGYAMGRFSGGGRAFDIGELGGVLKVAVFERRITLLVVPPANLKMFATGKGNADKEQVMKHMAKHRGRLFASDDEADAYALLLMGMAYSGDRRRPRDPRHYKYVALRGAVAIDARVS